MRRLLVPLLLAAAAVVVAGSAHARHAESGNPFTAKASERSVIHFVPLDARARRLLSATLPNVNRWLSSNWPTEITDIAASKPEWEIAERHQLDAQGVMRDMLGRWRAAQGKRQGFLVLVTSQSLYDKASPYFNFVFGTYAKPERGGQVANIVGTAQMRVFHPQRERARLTKMILRYVGVRACHLKYNNDPRSVLYKLILSDASLDRMVARLPHRC